MKARTSSSCKPMLTIIILIVHAVVVFICNRENVPRIINKINAIDIPFLKKRAVQ